jgi:predicted glycosyl hydrolase (DUF1957 family)
MSSSAALEPTSALPALAIEAAADRIVCRWGESLQKHCNPIDEELILRVYSGQEVVAEHRVERLSQKEIHLRPGTYRLELGRYFRPEVELRSPLYSTPVLCWHQDSPSSHLVAWSGIGWDDVRHQVEQVHQLDWEGEAAVALRVLWNRDGALVSEWIRVPNRDHATLQGRVEEIELAVIRARDESILKSLFLARQPERKPLQVLANETFTVATPQPRLRLYREIIESDTLQLRAVWSAFSPGQKQELEIVLRRGDEMLETHGPVGADGDWLFNHLREGSYTVEIRSRTAGKPKKGALSALSMPVHLPQRESRTRLMPVTERRAYAYWHVSRETWQGLTEELGDLLGRVRCYIQVGVRAPEGIRIISELTRPVDAGSTSDYYLDLAPDLIYHARLLAVIDDGERRPLTDWSNSCQLGRMGCGGNPIEHKREWQPGDHPTVRPLQGPTGTQRSSTGYLLIHLHAHLPFIADPIDFGKDSAWRPIGYPQEWYPEAVCDTYLPLLDIFEQLVSERVDFKLSMDISPPLAAMMKSQRHASDVLSFLERLIKLAQLEVERTGREQPYYQPAAMMHLRRYRRCRDLFLGYGGDLCKAFARFEELGHLEICTCVGTHIMLPLWTSEPSAIRGHCLAAARAHEQIFGRRSAGVWLPECSYTPGVEPFLEEAGFGYTFGEEHCVTRGDSPAEFGVNAPVYSKGSRLTVFPRDPETGRQVWSGEEGYPGDPDYLEFHIRGGVFKYNRITDRKGDYKEAYNPEWADNKASQQAGHFLHCRNARFEYLRHTMWKKPLIVAPYDAELFGHHWYEGPRFLYYLFKKLHYDQNQTELTTPSAYLAANPTGQDMHCNVSSWGHEGTFEKWMYGATSWMYRHGHEAAHSLAELCRQGADNELQHRVLAQAARQLMIATSSDLPFVISNGHFVDRMKDQFTLNLRAFYDLCEDYRRLRSGQAIDESRLRSLELENPIIANLQPQWFAAL